jgi:hypothetical protein
LSLHHEFCHWGNDKVPYCHLVVALGVWWWWENGFVILSLHHEFCHWGNDKMWFCHLVKMYRGVMMRKWASTF